MNSMMLCIDISFGWSQAELGSTLGHVLDHWKSAAPVAVCFFLFCLTSDLKSRTLISVEKKNHQKNHTQFHLTFSDDPRSSQEYLWLSQEMSSALYLCWTICPFLLSSILLFLPPFSFSLALYHAKFKQKQK